MPNDIKSGNGADEPAEATSELERARNRLRPFLEAHPYSTIDEIDSGEGKLLGINKPWGEDALVIFLPDDLDAIADALNNLYLPERFTAIWHKDQKEFEIIWTAFPLSAQLDEVKNRKFLFHFDSKEHECQFSRSSDRLLLIAEYAAPVALSLTGHRNLFSYRRYVERQKSGNEDGSPVPALGEPISFWIKNLEWDEDQILSLVRHLNFYMTYYDNKVPKIFIHSSKEEAAEPRTRYLIGNFPQRLDARKIEDDLLQLWAASREGDAGRRFIYCYRIIEYASHAYVDREARSQVRRLLSAPHALSDVAGLADRVVAAALSSKAEEIQRVANLVKDAVDPDLLWREINLNRSSFSRETTFDGGFTLPALIDADTTQNGFAVNGITGFVTSARHVRNHLSHGRDRTTQASIAPTVANFRKLEPWVSALSVVAGEVINFKHIL